MYAANNYRTKSPGNPAEFSNNPFLDDPSNPYTRFPDITGSSSLQSLPQHSQLGYGTGYADNTQYQGQQYPYWQQQQQHSGQYPGQAQTQNQNHFASTSYTPQYTNTSHQFMSQPTGAGFQFQPTGAFGQQASSQQYGYNNDGQQYSNQGYPQQFSPSYLSEFDPYAPKPTSPNRPQFSGSSGGNGPRGEQHPRDFLRSHKAELEAWDPYSWKQLINSCEALKDAWMIRKRHAESIVRQYGGGGGSPGFFGTAPQGYGYNNNSYIDGWKQAMKEAESNVDTAAASVFQMQEVYSSYRQSGDLASKRRVREATNAALTGLPDWPGPLS